MISQIDLVEREFQKKKKKILFSVLLEKHSTKIIVSLISFHQTNCLSIKETTKTVE